MQAGRDDARVVQNQHIAGIQVFKQAGKQAVFDFSRWAMQNQQTRIFPPGGRLLRDEFGWQIEMEISGSHRRERNGAGRGLTIHIGSEL